MHPNIRRTFFKASFSKSLSFIESICGKPQFKLEDLWDMDWENLGRIVPGIRSDVSIRVEGKNVYRVQKGTNDSFFIFSTEQLQTTAIFNKINGKNSIDAITVQLLNERHSAQSEIFHDVREFFLYLVKQEVCVPVNNVGTDAWSGQYHCDEKVKPKGMKNG